MKPDPTTRFIDWDETTVTVTPGPTQSAPRPTPTMRQTIMREASAADRFTWRDGSVK